MNHEVEVGDCQSYVNEVYNEGKFISDNNVKTFAKEIDVEDVQAPVQVDEDSKTLENNFSNSPHEFSLDAQESDHKQRESNMDQVVSIHAEYTEFFYP